MVTTKQVNTIVDAVIERAYIEGGPNCYNSYVNIDKTDIEELIPIIKKILGEQYGKRSKNIKNRES